MNTKYKNLFLIVTFFSVVNLSGCGESPENEIAQAKLDLIELDKIEKEKNIERLRIEGLKEIASLRASVKFAELNTDPKDKWKIDHHKSFLKIQMQVHGKLTESEESIVKKYAEQYFLEKKDFNK